ncbi:MAG: amino acid adenylation domain-containing protein [Lachnospiraceae bacterium]|nr:amino acid adenylation domain-containing protein [Lachnospiraceae bacterium]MCM1231350.1 amino acid adenylation domain-containing protein [Ruminococcus flavefaciens]
MDFSGKIAEWNNTDTVTGYNDNINILLHESAVKYSERYAVSDSRGFFTYGQLDSYSNAVCNLLLADKDKTGSGNICILAGAQAERLCFVTGVLKAGMTYVPLDTKAPLYRNRQIIENVNCTYILTDTENCRLALETAGECAEKPVVKVLGIDELAVMDNSYTQVRAGLGRIAYIIHTSGSTGKPKGVKISDRALNNFCWSMQHQVAHITEEDRTCALQNFSFDVSIADMFLFMLSGACIYFVPDDIKRDVSKLNDFITENGITKQSMTTALYHMYSEYDNPVLKKIFTGGEKMVRYNKRSYDVYNLYGPTETTVFVTYEKVTRHSDNIPIGTPFMNTKIIIVKEDGSLADINEKGEICIMGDSLADGYINNEEETKKHFVPSVIDSSKLMYRSGDVGMWNDDGKLVCFGRVDHQIKHRGFRIELDEINSHIASLDNIADSIVIYDDRRENKYIACFYCTADGSEISSEEFKVFLENKLPEYMMPAKWVRMDSLPLNNNGKINRGKLFEILEKEYIENISQSSDDTLEETVKSIWCELLNVNNFSADAHFRSLGGHSIMSFLMLKRLRERTGAEVTFTEFMQADTLNKLCALIRSKNTPEKNDFSVKRTVKSIWCELLNVKDFDADAHFRSLGGHSIMSFLMLKRLRERTGADVTFTEFMQADTLNKLCALISSKNAPEKKDFSAILKNDPENRYEPFALNSIQQSYYYGRMSRKLGNVSTAVYLEFSEKNIDVPRLEKALNQLVQRHEMLRCVICGENEQRIIQSPGEIRLTLEDMSDIASQENRAEIADRICNEMFGDFVDLKKFPAFKFRVVRFSDDDYRIFTVLDCTFIDGASIGLLINDMYSLYNGNEPAPLKISFRDYLTAVENEKEGYEEGMKYWLDRIDTLPETPPVPVVRENGTGERNNTVRKEAFIPPEIWEKLKKLAVDNNLSLFVIQVTVFAIILSRWSGKTHFTLNIPIFNRFLYDEQVMKLAGEFGSLIFLEVDLDENKGFIENCKKISRQFEKDMEHRTVNGVDIIREYKEHGRTLYMPIVFTSLTTPDGKGGIYNDDTNLLRWKTHSSQVWLDSIVFDKKGGIEIAWDCYGGVFADVLIDDMFGAYVDCYRKAVDDSSFIEQSIKNAVNGRNYDCVISTNRTEYLYEGKPELLHRCFMESLKNAPDSTACVTKNRSFSYSEIYRYASATAMKLREAGMEKGDFTAVIMEKGWKQVTAVLAVLLAGGTYVPVSPQWPETRVSAVFRNAGIRYAVTDNEYFGGIDYRSIYVDENSCETSGGYEAVTDISPDSPAYVIYTSGSTGEPKGVVISHRAVLNTIFAVNRRNGITSSDRSIMLSELYFDLSVYDIFGMFSCGGSVYVPDSSEKNDPLCWKGILTEKKITVWNTVPALMQMFTDINAGEKADGSVLRKVFLSGDWIPLNLPEKIRNTLGCVDLVSMGGATEASIWSNYFNVENVADDWKSIPYGYPLDNQCMFVLDENMEICPECVAGEIFIGGKGLATGYLGDKELTDEKFFFCEKLGMRLYRTGDRGMYRDKNVIEFLGRSDDQVKLNGFRIELGEIESYALKLDGIKSAVANFNRNNNRIEFYYMSDGKVSVEDIVNHLGKGVPDYMIPSAFMEINSIPMNPNGKVDRKNLPEINVVSQEITESTVLSETEKVLADIFRTVLGRENFSANDNFFTSGGDSLKAIRLIAEINRKFGCHTDLADIFSNPLLRNLAERIDSLCIKEDSDDTSDNDVQDSVYRLTPVQKLLFISSLTGQRTYFSVLTGYIDIHSAVNAELIKKAVAMAVDRHNVLNFVFGLDDNGEPYQKPGSEKANIERIFVTEETDCFEKRTAELSETRLDLADGIVCRFVLMHKNGTDDEYRLCAVIHHIAADEQSFMMIFSEIMSYYDELSENSDFSAGSTGDDGYGKYLIGKQKPADTDMLAYWDKVFADNTLFDGSLFAGTENVGSDNGVTKSFSVDEEILRQYEKLCSENNTTLFVGLLSAVFISLYCVTGKSHLAMIVPFTDRINFSQEQPFGMFVDDMLIYTELDKSDTFEDVLQKTMKSFMDSYSAGSGAMYSSLEKLGLENSYFRNRLKLPFFDLINAERSGIKSRLLDISQFRYYINRDVAERDLSYIAEYTDGRYDFSIGCKYSAVTEETAEELIGIFRNVLTKAVDNTGFGISEL